MKAVQFKDRSRKCGHSTIHPSEACSYCRTCETSNNRGAKNRKEILLAESALETMPEYLMKYLEVER